MATENLKIKTAWLSLIVGLAIFSGKITAFLLTSSAAIYSDAAESVVHIIATLVVVYSIYLSNKPPDRSHLYGHGNVEYFSAGIEGLLIIIAAFTIIYEAIMDLIYGTELKNLDIGTFIIGAAGFINLYLGYFIVKRGKITNSTALIADGKHILTDSFTSLGVLFGLILILLTGLKIIDPIIAVIVAVNILFTGYKLIRESIGELMNETDMDLLNEISRLFQKLKKEYWIDMHNLRFWKSADRIFIDCHLTLPFYFTIKESHIEEEFISSELQKWNEKSEIRIHFDYCTYQLCRNCEYSDCTMRKEDFDQKIEWSVNKLIGEPINLKTHIS
ncbi:MAG: cation transporter [Melioribacteraceae bacterium]|nr:cation transporter [Melioribacteraceae bacterium]